MIELFTLFIASTALNSESQLKISELELTLLSMCSLLDAERTTITSLRVRKSSNTIDYSLMAVVFSSHCGSKINHFENRCHKGRPKIILK